ncbi:hypothetical protein BH11MYX4_BH11MYX4_49290 [soil metagenome]
MGSRSILGWTAAAVSLALSAAVGCGSTDGTPGETVDAAPEADQPLEADVPDAADARVDAADARPDVLLPAAGYCLGLAKKPKFCDDFDDLDLTNDWDQATVLPQSVMDLDDSTFASAPVSYVVATKAILASGAAGNVSLRKTVLGSVSHATLAFSARFSTTTVTKGLLAVATLDVSSNHFFTLYLRDGDAAAPAAILEELTASTMTRHLLTRLPVAGSWTRIVIDVDLAAGKANVTFGGQPALVDAPIDATVGTEATIRLGAVYVYPPSDPFQANFDDVVLDF